MAEKIEEQKLGGTPPGTTQSDALQFANSRSNSQTKVNRFTESRLPLLISSYYSALSHKRHFPCKVLQRKMEDFRLKRQGRPLCLHSKVSSESGLSPQKSLVN